MRCGVKTTKIDNNIIITDIVSKKALDKIIKKK